MLRQQHFKKYFEASICLNFTSVPFSKVKAILSTKEEQFTVQCRTSFEEGDGMKMVSVPEETRGGCHHQHEFSALLTGAKLNWSQTRSACQLIKDIRVMLKFMNPVDKKFISGILPKERHR
ncbi:hypothetical protein SNE40_013043 [Patella caerulea]|uniref:Uncharacterized protein n=1 Tax=Patella caerulea TaxID=87958 RepID=A0AAN8JMS1_PATCE